MSPPTSGRGRPTPRRSSRFLVLSPTNGPGQAFPRGYRAVEVRPNPADGVGAAGAPVYCRDWQTARIRARVLSTRCTPTNFGETRASDPPREGSGGRWTLAIPNPKLQIPTTPNSQIPSQLPTPKANSQLAKASSFGSWRVGFGIWRFGSGWDLELGIWDLPQTFLIKSSIASGGIGLVRWWSKPASAVRRRSSSWPQPVNAIRTMPRPTGGAMRRATSKRSDPHCRGRAATSGMERSAMVRPRSRSRQSDTSWPASCSQSCRLSAASRLSSAIRIVSSRQPRWSRRRGFVFGGSLWTRGAAPERAALIRAAALGRSRAAVQFDHRADQRQADAEPAKARSRALCTCVNMPKTDSSISGGIRCRCRRR